ncbi:MAG: hypothetical protein IJ228_01030 [Succinivibrio sp.]|nr:hypothetical protein [Succinivibrio sp.]
MAKENIDFAEVLNNYPGVKAEKYHWRDMQHQDHEMNRMDLAYLVNARNEIFQFIEGRSSDTQEYALIKNKVAEFDKAIALLEKHTAGKASQVRLSSSLVDFGFSKVSDIDNA